MKGLLVHLLLAAVYAQELLSNVYITFGLGGNVNYYPPSGGGLAVPGYQMTVGFDRFSWLGVMFMTPTYTNSYDILIVKRASTQSGGLYSCTIKDYYVTSGRPTNLMSDTNTNMDLMTPTSASSSAFQISVPRTKANTSGEDWEGGEFVEICFFTSDADFSESSWSKQYEACYGYSVNNFVSIYRGNYLTTMGFEGVNARVYGGIYGPILQMQLFWYRLNPTMANTSAIIVQIGDRVSDLVGYDYYQCGVGDFFGESPTTLQKDLDYSGFQNGACSVSSTANSVSLSYTRQAYTFDDFDSTITQGLTICLIGSLSHCSSISLPLNFPIMSVSSALTIGQSHLRLLALCLLFLIMI